MSSQSKKYQTQWASQFYVAAELTRRGYQVALTLGNAPIVDLMAISPNLEHFKIDVKGQSTKNFWLIQGRESSNDLFYILVYLPKNEEPPKCFIMSSSEVMRERDDYEKHIKSIKGKYRDDMGGFNWTTCLKYKNKWETLPE